MLAFLDEADSLNRAYAPLPSDSLLRQAADFFDRHGTPGEQVRAHYLLGCAYRDQGQAPEALQSYQDALDRADTLGRDCDHQRLMAVYGQMAELYDAQNLPQDELEMLDQYALLAIRTADSLKYIRSIEAKSKVYDLLGDTTMMISSLLTAGQLYETAGYHQEAVQTLSPLIYVNISRGNYDEASRLMGLYEAESGLFGADGEIKEGFETYYYFKGLYYLRCGDATDAEYFMRKLFDSQNDNLNACRGLMEVYRQMGNLDSVSKYSILFENANDSLENCQRAETIHRMASLYNYHQYQLTAERAMKSTAVLRFIIVTILFAVLFIISAIVRHYRRYKSRHLAEITKLSVDYHQAKLSLSKVMDELHELKSNQSAFIAAKEREIVKLKDMVKEHETRWLNISQREKESVLNNQELVCLFRKKAGGGRNNPLPTENQWNHLKTLFDQFFSTATSTTDRRFSSLSILELRVYMLIMLKFTNGEIAVLLDVTPQRITNIKSRINHKLFADSTASNLEKNIKSAISSHGLKLV